LLGGSLKREKGRRGGRKGKVSIRREKEEGGKDDEEGNLLVTVWDYQFFVVLLLLRQGPWKKKGGKKKGDVFGEGREGRGGKLTRIRKDEFHVYSSMTDCRRVEYSQLKEGGEKSFFREGKGVTRRRQTGCRFNSISGLVKMIWFGGGRGGGRQRGEEKAQYFDAAYGLLLLPRQRETVSEQGGKKEKGEGKKRNAAT